MPKKGKGGSKGGSKGGKASAKANKVHVRHILCEKNKKLLEAKAQLDEGKGFAEVARNYSEDKARSGGDLGWITKGKTVPKFEEIAFKLSVGEVSAPFKTEHGWHIVTRVG